MLARSCLLMSRKRHVCNLLMSLASSELILGIWFSGVVVVIFRVPSKQPRRMAPVPSCSIRARSHCETCLADVLAMRRGTLRAACIRKPQNQGSKAIRVII